MSRTREFEVVPVLLFLAAASAACGGNEAPPSSATAPDASLSDAGAVNPYAAECADAGSLPNSIECTGLFTNVATKAIAPGIEPYAPAVPLWSDYAEKQRWILLPPGTQIDATDPNEWVFPVGTKVWKQFTRDGILVETRMFEKTQPTYWQRTTYAWNPAGTEATISAGGDMPWGSDGGVYHIPTSDECDQCHKGRTDHLLGFEQVSLGLSGATGLTLTQLVAKGLISPVPALTNLSVGDDGTGVAAPAIEWLHINCGVTCHNDNSNSTGYGSNMRLRLDPTLLDGGPSTNFETRTTTIGVLANNPMWNDKPRIVAGQPTQSLLVTLITNRGTNNPADNQMPPIATDLIDPVNTQNVISWIQKMPTAP